MPTKEDKPHRPHDKPKPPPKGPKERELAVLLTTASVQAAAGKVEFASLKEAATAVAAVYDQTFEVVTKDRG
jgi:TRAP-type uncharacterized transport system substrate-binding protein